MADYVFGSLYGKSPEPLPLFCRPSNDQHLIYVRLRSDQAESAIRQVMIKYNPVYPFQYRLVDEQFNGLFVNELSISKLSAGFATLAIILSCLGLFGLAAYMAEQRLKEVGIRKVLGATMLGITGLLSKDFIKLVGFPLLIAFPVSWRMMHNWLQNYEYRITMSWAIFLIAGILCDPDRTGNGELAGN